MFVAGAGLLLVVAILLVPIHVCAEKNSASAPLYIRLRWFFGLVHYQTVIENLTPSRSRPREKKVKENASTISTVFLSRRVATRSLQVARSLFASLHLVTNQLLVEIGFSDPADTGMAWAFLGPASGWLVHQSAGKIVMYPNFLEPSFVVYGDMQATVVPLQVIGIVLGFFLSPVVVSAMYRARGNA